MTPILTEQQAQQVGAAMAAVGLIGANTMKVSIQHDAGWINIRMRSDGSVYVRKEHIGRRDQKRQYSNLAEFAEAHANYQQFHAYGVA